MAADGTMQADCEVVRSHGGDDTLNIEVYRRVTNELCTGQINGRALVCTAAPETGPAPTPTEEASVFQLQSAQHESGAFSINLPDSWAKRESGSGDGYLQLTAGNENEQTDHK